MKKHIPLFLTFIMMACLSAGAQENQAELKSKVNEIKKSPDYIYAEATRETAEEAKSAAEEQLYNNINIWVAHEKDLRGAKHVVVAQTKSDYEEFQLQRGNMTRAFLYVKKSDIITGDNVRVLDVNPLKEGEAKDDKAQQPADLQPSLEDAIEGTVPGKARSAFTANIRNCPTPTTACSWFTIAKAPSKPCSQPVRSVTTPRRPCPMRLPTIPAAPLSDLL